MAEPSRTIYFRLNYVLPIENREIGPTIFPETQDIRICIKRYNSKIIQNEMTYECVYILTLISLLAFSQIFQIAEFDKFVNNIPYIYLSEGEGCEITSSINIFHILFNYIALITYFCI